MLFPCRAFPSDLVKYNKSFCNRQGLERRLHDLALVRAQDLQPFLMNKIQPFGLHLHKYTVQGTAKRKMVKLLVPINIQKVLRRKILVLLFKH